MFDGRIVNEVEAKDRNVGIVFQSYTLYPHMTVRDNILFPLRFKRVPREAALDRVRAAASLVQVEELLDRRPGELSGGQQQWVALARALIKEPQLLLLDEPLSNLDATLRLTMRTQIKSLQKKLGVTTILVTHDQIEATTMADRIICMRAGRVEQIGMSDDLYRKPESLFIASFIGSPPINLIRGEARDGAASIGSVVFPFEAPPGAVTVGLRPEHLRFAGSGLGGRIAQIEPMGRDILYVVETGVGDVHLLQHGNSARHRTGEPVNIGFSPDDTLVFDTASERLIGGARGPPAYDQPMNPAGFAQCHRLRGRRDLAWTETLGYRDLLPGSASGASATNGHAPCLAASKEAGSAAPASPTGCEQAAVGGREVRQTRADRTERR